MRFVVKTGELLGAGLLVARESDDGLHDESGRPRLAIFAFLKVASGFVFVAVDDVAAHRGNREEGEHVATDEGCGVSFFGINAIGIAEVDHRR